MKVFLTIIFVFQFFMGVSQDYKSVDETEGIEEGATVPMFKALTADSTEFSLEAALEKGPVVLIFYRGFWCPHCNRHLAQVQDSLSLIQEAGAEVIAISPEKPEYLDVMAEKTGARFTLLYDEGHKISDAFDVTFLPKASQLRSYNMFMRADMKNSHSDDSERLPIPATYVIDQQGKVVWRQFDQDYKNRSNVADILDALGYIK
jgi:peroxiredoxin